MLSMRITPKSVRPFDSSFHSSVDSSVSRIRATSTLTSTLGKTLGTPGTNLVNLGTVQMAWKPGLNADFKKYIDNYSYQQQCLGFLLLTGGL
jgi:hypothetical protein